MVDFPGAADHWVKMKESKKIEKYLDLAREQKKQWNMKVRVILIVVGAFWMVSKSLKKRLRELEIETV